jgi:peptidoglycan/LPS O-acetylase OafA/YrhL
VDRSSRVRLVFIDALRAAACLAVVVFHALCTTELQPGLRGAIPAGVWKVTGLLGFRVQTLFLLSGFLAALSLRRIDGSWRSAGTSLLRRQARLAPAYWAMIGIGLSVGYVERWRSRVPPVGEGPGWSDVLLNMSYLQAVVPGALVWMAASVAASIAAMQVFHALVERPLTQLVRRGVSLPKRGERRAGVELPAFTQAA